MDSYSTNTSVYTTERIVKITEFEEMYFNLYKNNLSKMSKADMIKWIFKNSFSNYVTNGIILLCIRVKGL